MSGSFEEQYMGFLQNIEFALVTVYRNNPKMNDHAALFVIESLVKLYNAETQGRAIASPQFQPHEQEAFDGVKALLDWRLGWWTMLGRKFQSAKTRIRLLKLLPASNASRNPSKVGQNVAGGAATTNL